MFLATVETKESKQEVLQRLSSELGYIESLVSQKRFKRLMTSSKTRFDDDDGQAALISVKRYLLNNLNHFTRLGYSGESMESCNQSIQRQLEALPELIHKARESLVSDVKPVSFKIKREQTLEVELFKIARDDTLMFSLIKLINEVRWPASEYFSLDAKVTYMDMVVHGLITYFAALQTLTEKSSMVKYERVLDACMKLGGEAWLRGHPMDLLVYDRWTLLKEPSKSIWVAKEFISTRTIMPDYSEGFVKVA